MPLNGCRTDVFLSNHCHVNSQNCQREWRRDKERERKERIVIEISNKKDSYAFTMGNRAIEPANNEQWHTDKTLNMSIELTNAKVKRFNSLQRMHCYWRAFRKWMHNSITIEHRWRGNRRKGTRRIQKKNSQIHTEYRVRRDKYWLTVRQIIMK